MLVLMFGYLFGGGMSVPGGGDYREFLMPGMFAMTMLFGIEATYTAVTTDATGVSPTGSVPCRWPVRGGRGPEHRRHAQLRTGLVVMVACGLLVGWGWHHPRPGALAVGLLLLLRFALLWVGIYLGLVLRNPRRW